MILPFLFGVIGVAILLGLGTWQVQRLAWKNGILNEITTRIKDTPIAIPSEPDPESDKYLPVQATGTVTQDELHVLVSLKQVGAGYRIISAFETDGRRILLDRGFVGVEQKDAPRLALDVEVKGNLHWPDEVDGYTPAPDLAENIWFARDVDSMAQVLKTEPVFLVVRETSESNPTVTPLPVDISGIPNDHLGYAITWFSLAFVWLGMTAAILWRIRQRTK